MKKIVFTKYSNERNPQFAIKTVIVQKNNQFFVQKYPLTEKAHKHVNDMYINSHKINEFYGQANFKAAKCYKTERGVSFDFIKGNTFDYLLENSSNIYDTFQMLRNLYDKLMNCKNVTVFKRTSEFDKIFGTETFPEKLHAIDGFACFDLAFNNLIVQQDTINIIDYEWCFDFSIPIEFIFYRALKIFIILKRKNELIQKDIYAYLGFDKKIIDCFEDAEENFQKFIRSNTLCMRELYQKFEVKNYNINDIINKGNEIESKKKQCYSQIYIDYGEGFSEQNSIRQAFLPEQPVISDIVISDKVKVCRFDPNDESCIMLLKRIAAICPDGMYVPEYTTNGCKIHSVIFFNDSDPQIIFNNLKDNTSLIQIEFVIIKSDSEYSDSLAKAFFDISENKKIISNLNSEIDNNKNHIQQLNSEINNNKNYIQQLNSEINNNKSYIQQLNSEIDNNKNYIQQLNSEINNNKIYIQNLNTELQNTTESYNKANQYISDIENSRAWKLVTKIRKLLRR